MKLSKRIPFVLFAMTCLISFFETKAQQSPIDTTNVKITNEECRTVHTGKFTLTSEYGTTNIKRTKRFQVEQSDEDDFKSKSRVKWIDDCNYVLFDDKLIRGPEFLEPKAGEELYVEILSIEANMVKVKTTANFIDLVRETTMLIVK